MDKQERRAYLEAIRTRYWRARKSGETAILDEFCAVPDSPHKYALRLLRASGKQSRSAARKPGRASRHAVPELVEALRTIWLADATRKLYNPLISRLSARQHLAG
jgi:hypothetical protein